MRLGILCVLLGIYLTAAPVWAAACGSFARGHAAYGLGRWESAIERYGEALDSCNLSDSRRIFALYRSGRAYANLEQPGIALGYYDQVIALAPNYVPGHSSRCYVLYSLERYEEALVSCDQALSLDPNNGPSYSIRAMINAERGDRRAAESDFAEALRLDPGNWAIFYNRAERRNDWGETNGARADLEVAWRLAPEWGRHSSPLFKTYGFK